jgi:hypothetical protein
VIEPLDVLARLTGPGGPVEKIRVIRLAASVCLLARVRLGKTLVMQHIDEDFLIFQAAKDLADPDRLAALIEQYGR